MSQINKIMSQIFFALSQIVLSCKHISTTLKTNIMNFNYLKINKKTAIISLITSSRSICNLDRYKVLAICLLTGAYNPLRKFSKKGCPIDLLKLSKYKERFEDLLNEVINDMDVDVEEVEKIS